ncbi:crAss001_48 related protein [Vibrio alginolyticus]
MSHLERVKTERNELKDKIDALSRFIYEQDGIYDSLDKEEQVRLAQQMAIMKAYIDILDSRLCAAYGTVLIKMGLKKITP